MDREPHRYNLRKKKTMEDLSSRSNKKPRKTNRQRPDIPHDIMLDIFTRLPPKSLFRFKCVCKGWLALFQDKTFMDFYAFHRRQKVVNLLGRVGDSFLFFSLDKTAMVPTKIPLSFKVSEWYSFTSACNGLFCIAILDLGLMVWNPITNESKVVHVEEPGVRKYIGFGFDVVSNKFKVIRNYTSTQIQVLTVGNEEWRNVQGGTLNGLRFPMDKVIYLNGSLHWLTRTEGGRIINGITSFNLGDETFGMLPSPCHDPLFRLYWLCEFEGCLCISGFDGPKVLNLWLWIGNEEKWINQRISLPFKSFRIPFEAFCSINSVTYLTSGEILVECLGDDCSYLCCYKYDKQQRQKEIQLVKVTKLVGLERMVVIGKHDENIESLQRFCE